MGRMFGEFSLFKHFGGQMNRSAKGLLIGATN